MPIRFFDDVQEAIDDIYSRRAEADSVILRWQWALPRAGTYAIRIADGVLIYTKIVEELKAPHLRGFVFGKHYRIVSNVISNGVGILRTESITRASQLPVLKHAVDRLGRLQEIVEMIASMKWKPVSEDEREIILHLHRQGHTLGEITSLLWAELGIARRPSTVKGVIGRGAGTGK